VQLAKAFGAEVTGVCSTNTSSPGCVYVLNRVPRVVARPELEQERVALLIQLGASFARQAQAGPLNRRAHERGRVRDIEIRRDHGSPFRIEVSIHKRMASITVAQRRAADGAPGVSAAPRAPGRWAAHVAARGRVEQRARPASITGSDWRPVTARRSSASLQRPLVSRVSTGGAWQTRRE
jgi:hypothetical protein